MVKKFLLIIALTFSISHAKEFKSMDFNITSTNGDIINIKGVKKGIEVKEAKGKVVLIEFWGTHCPPCLMSISHYINLKNKYKDKIEMLAFEVEGASTDYLKKFIQKKGINYKVFELNENRNFISYIGARLGWKGAIPYLAIFDTNGNIIDIRRGMVSGKYVDKVVEYLLNHKQRSKDTNSTNNN